MFSGRLGPAEGAESCRFGPPNGLEGVGSLSLTVTGQPRSDHHLFGTDAGR